MQLLLDNGAQVDHTDIVSIIIIMMFRQQV